MCTHLTTPECIWDGKSMKTNKVIAWVLAFVSSLGFFSGGLNDANANEEKLSIKGSYVLEYRVLPDGKKVASPNIIGVMTYTESYRNFNVYWNENGKGNSISLIAKYTLTDKTYTEDSIFYAADFNQKAIVYDVTPAHGTSTVTSKGGKTQFQFPLHGEPACELEKNGFTATMPGVFVDHWKKID